MRAKAVTIKWIGIAAVGFISFTSLAHAEEEQMAPPEVTTQSSGDAKAPAVKGKKKETKINFDDEAIEGELKKPELFYMFQKKQFNFKRLIKLRDDFLPEMRRDADEVRRSRSK